MGNPLSRFECRIETPLAAAALTPGLLKNGKEVDINHFPVSLAHAHASVLKATAKQHVIRLTREMVSCSACYRAKGNRTPNPYHATRRATQPLGLVHTDTTGPYPTSLGGVTVRRDVRRQRFASTAATRRARKERGRHCFCHEMLRGRYGSPTRVPHRQRQRLLEQYVRGLLQWSWNSSRGYGTVYAIAEWIRVASAISRAFEPGHAACPGPPQLYPDIRLEEIRDCTDAAGTSLWLEGGNTSERRVLFPS